VGRDHANEGFGLGISQIAWRPVFLNNGKMAANPPLFEAVEVAAKP